MFIVSREVTTELFVLLYQIVLNENPVLDELSVEYVPQIGFLTTLNKRFGDLAPPDFSFAFAQVCTRSRGKDFMYVLSEGDLRYSEGRHKIAIVGLFFNFWLGLAGNFLRF